MGAVRADSRRRRRATHCARIRRSCRPFLARLAGSRRGGAGASGSDAPVRHLRLGAATRPHRVRRLPAQGSSGLPKGFAISEQISAQFKRLRTIAGRLPQAHGFGRSFRSDARRSAVTQIAIRTAYRRSPVRCNRTLSRGAKPGQPATLQARFTPLYPTARRILGFTIRWIRPSTFEATLRGRGATPWAVMGDEIAEADLGVADAGKEQRRAVRRSGPRWLLADVPPAER
jgi:hypothetical protein